MKLPKKTSYLIFLAIGLLNLLLRWPRATHESGVDSFVWHGLATSIASTGNALFVLNPLSYLGLYPLSHPSGSLFWSSGFSLASGLPLEWSIYVLNLVVALIGMLGGFMLAREFWDNDAFCLLVALLFSTAPEFVISLIWQMPTRIMFTALIPFFLWALVRTHRTGMLRYLAIAVLALLLMMSFHRLTVLMVIVVIAYVLTYLLLVTARVIRLRFPAFLLSPDWRRRVPYLALGVFFLIVVLVFLATDVLQEYSEGRFGSGDAPPTQLLNLSVSLMRSAGLLLPLVLVGVVAVSRRRNKDLREPLILIILLCLIPTLLLRQYTGYYTIPFTSLFIGFGVLAVLLRTRRKRLRMAAAAGVVTFLLASTVMIVDYDLSVGTTLSPETYGTALYVNDRVAGSILANDGLHGARLSAIAGAAYLPVGGATTPFQSPELLVFGFESPGDLNIVQVPLVELTVESDSPFVLVGVHAELDWALMYNHNVSEIPRAYDKYNVTHLYEVKGFYEGYYAYGNFYRDRFLSITTHDFRYKIFESTEETLWYLG